MYYSFLFSFATFFLLATENVAMCHLLQCAGLVHVSFFVIIIVSFLLFFIIFYAQSSYLYFTC